VRIVFYKEVLKIALIGIACSTFDLFAQSAARVYPFPPDPREHPDDTRRGVKPPDVGTFKNQLQFIALRSMGDNYMTDLERYVVKDRLGDILWPHYSMLYHPARKEMVQEIKKRDYLEQNMTAEKVCESMAKNLKWLCNEAAKKGVTLHMRQSPLRHTDLKDFPSWLKTVGEPNFKAAPSLGATNLDGTDPEWLLKQIEPAAVDLVLLSAADRDIYTQVTSIHEPIASTFDAAALKPLITALDQKGCRLVYDAIYDNADEEYADAKLIESLK